MSTKLYRYSCSNYHKLIKNNDKKFITIVTHQAPGSVAACYCLFRRMDVLTDGDNAIKPMTTFSPLLVGQNVFIRGADFNFCFS